MNNKFKRGGSGVAEYEGPSFFKHSKRQSSNPSTSRLKENLQFFKSSDQYVDDRGLFSERSTHTLPDQIIKRDEIEKGFQDYLEERKAYHQVNRSKHYIEPPFEASKVPSPIFGYKKPLKKDRDNWDYLVLKKELEKEHFEYLMFEEFETSELIEYWQMQLNDEAENLKNAENSKSLSENRQSDLSSSKVPFETEIKKETKNSRNKRMKLQRSLMNIINEEQLGKNGSKRNLPGFFSDENE